MKEIATEQEKTNYYNKELAHFLTEYLFKKAILYPFGWNAELVNKEKANTETEIYNFLNKRRKDLEID